MLKQVVTTVLKDYHRSFDHSLSLLQDYQKNVHENNMLQKKIQRLSSEKVSLEDSILERLQDQITQDKAAKYLNKVLQSLRNKTRDQVR
jgi:hypothetical protein